MEGQRGIEKAQVAKELSLLETLNQVLQTLPITDKQHHTTRPGGHVIHDVALRKF